MGEEGHSKPAGCGSDCEARAVDLNLAMYTAVAFKIKVERRYGRKYGCDPAGRGAHLHANWSFSPPPTLMAMKLPTIGNHI